MCSFLSTATPTTVPVFHLLGSGIFGKVSSYSKYGTIFTPGLAGASAAPARAPSVW